jgi:hypothetical protein
LLEATPDGSVCIPALFARRDWRSAFAKYHIMSTSLKTCRNCGGTEFYVGDAARTVAITFFAIPPKFHLRVCGTCGLLDWFVPEQDLQVLKKKFSPERA